jgi:hypothetical protein
MKWIVVFFGVLDAYLWYGFETASDVAPRGGSSPKIEWGFFALVVAFLFVSNFIGYLGWLFRWYLVRREAKEFRRGWEEK